MSRPVAALACLACVAGAASPRPASAAAGWRWPVDGEVITHYRNGADPYAGGQHRGIDIAAEAGTPVVAAAGGTVRFAGVAGPRGSPCRSAPRTGASTRPTCISPALAVREGDVVSAGDRLGSGRRRAAGARCRRRTCTSACARPARGTPTSIRSRCSGRRRHRGRPRRPRVAPVPAAGAGGAGSGARAAVRVPAARRVRLPAGRRRPRGRAAARAGAGVPASAPAPRARARARLLRPLPAPESVGSGARAPGARRRRAATGDRCPAWAGGRRAGPRRGAACLWPHAGRRPCARGMAAVPTSAGRSRASGCCWPPR